jgi:phosphoglycolate phosphatase
MTPPVCLLDLDGTLTNPFTGISRSIEHALQILGFPVPEAEALKAWIGPPLRSSFERYFNSNGGGDPDEAVRLYRERFANIGLFENIVYDGIPALLEDLHRNSIPLLVATSKPTVYAQRIIRHFELEHWIEAVHGSELDGHNSDKSDLLGHILEQWSLNPSDCVMVGDREFDMRAARQHKIAAIGVLWGYGSPLELLEAGAETLVSTPAELNRLLIDSI